MKRITIIAFILLFLLVSCHKDNTIGGNMGTPNPASINYGSVLVIESHNTISNATISFNYLKAYALFNKITTYPNGTSIVGYSDVDSVFFDGIALKKIPYSIDYFLDSLFSPPSPPLVWKVKGSSGYPSYSDTLNYLPACVNFAIPDTFRLTDSTAIRQHSVNSDSLTIEVTGQNFPNEYYFFNKPTQDSIIFISNLSHVMSSTANGTLKLTFFKKYQRIFLGQKIYFNVYTSYLKTIQIQ